MNEASPMPIMPGPTVSTEGVHKTAIPPILRSMITLLTVLVVIAMLATLAVLFAGMLGIARGDSTPCARTG